MRRWQEFWDKLEPPLVEIYEIAQDQNIPMLNSLEMLRWVGNKGGYLRDLERNGLEIIPTKLIGPDDKIDLPKFMELKRDGVVIKPSIAASEGAVSIFPPRIG